MKNNKYLEKVAGWRSKLEGTNAGKAMGSLSEATNASVLASLGQSKTMNSYSAGDKVTKLQGGFMGLGKKPVQVSSGAMKTTGDSLAGGKNLAGRLADFKADKAARAAATGGKGILGKAIGLAKKNPFIAGAAIGGAGILGAKALSKKNDPYGYQ